MTRVFLFLLGHVLKVLASYLGVVGRRVYCKLVFLLAGNLTKSPGKKKILTVPAFLYICPLLVVVDNGESFLPFQR